MGDLTNDIDQLSITTIRMLSADAVEQAKSGHPGLPLGAAPMAYVLWTHFMRFNPANPQWPNRDRFILSAGHGSALLYALLHLTGYDLSLDDLKHFRQWGSKTPGHPEYGLTPGVEATTGPLGQGFAMGVGMALAERFLAARFNRADLPIVDHYTYAIVSDGDLMEGISSEAASLAGHLKLGKIVYLYDDNHISIEGPTEITFTEDVDKRFEAYGWHVQSVGDGNDLGAIEAAIANARQEAERPSLIRVRTRIGYGSPKQDDASVHGAPLGEAAHRKTREFFGWQDYPWFHVPDEVAAHMRQALERGRENEEEWRRLTERYAESYPQEWTAVKNGFDGVLPEGWDAELPVFDPKDGPVATRKASGKALQAPAARLPVMLGGSADLGPSNNTLIESDPDHSAETPAARNIRFGVREHAMAAMMNGMALHGGVIPYAGTFFIFSDYMRPSIRLACLMNVRSIFIFTHDSVAVGEDGPTHEPIEHLASLRAMPNLVVLRPGDANETSAAWKIAIERTGPTALILTRQKIPTFEESPERAADGVAKGAYVLSDTDGPPDLLLIATGSEVHLALQAKERLQSERGVKVRVVSMPSWELFQDQTVEYRESVLPASVKKRLAVEAAATFGWERWVGDQGDVIGIDRFGASAPGGQVLEKLGINLDHIVKRALDLMG